MPIISIEHSRPFGIPLLKVYGLSVLPWTANRLAFLLLYGKPLTEFGLRGIPLWVAYNEWASWKRWYEPPLSIETNDLIVDVGAGQGETVFFFYLHGFRKFRAIELNKDYCLAMARNVQKLTGVTVEIRNKSFEASDLKDAAFAKIDCEGGEYSFLCSNSRFGNSFVIETHSACLEKMLKRKFPTANLVEVVSPTTKVFRVSGLSD